MPIRTSLAVSYSVRSEMGLNRPGMVNAVEISSADGVPGVMVNVRDTSSTDVPQFEQLKVMT